MKIIKHGKRVKDIVKQVECHNCGCIFEIKLGEANLFTELNDLSNTEIHCFSIKCPDCKADIERAV